MKKLFFILLLFGSVRFLQAQDVNSINTTMTNFRLSMLPEVATFEAIARYYDGNPFLEDEWLPGRVAMVSGQVLEYPMKYFVYADQILLKNEQDSIRSLNLSEQVRDVKIGDRIFVYDEYYWGSKMKKGILELLYRGTFGNVFLLHTCKIEKGREANGYQEREKDAFRQQHTLYYNIEDAEITALPRTKRDFFRIFGVYAARVEKFCKENRLKTNPEDMPRIFTYYDELKKEENQ